MNGRLNTRGATLLEAVAAVLVLGIAIPPLLSISIEIGSRGADQALQVAALECADSLMEEIASKVFEDPQLPTGSFGSEEASRAAFDDIDDYDGLSNAPPRHFDGALLSDYASLLCRATVDNVTAANLDPALPESDGSTPFKRIQVRVSWTGARGGEVRLTTLRTRVGVTRGPLQEGAVAR